MAQTGKVYQIIAQTLQAYQNCMADPAKADWADKHRERIDGIVKNCLPSGSGIDSGTKFDWDKSTPDKLVFQADYHHMDGNGYYSGWAEHQVIVKASLAFGLEIRITGRDRDNIKDYLSDCYHSALTDTAVWSVKADNYILERWADLENRPAVAAE